MINQKSGAGTPFILVVEDEALVRMSTVASLEDLGCTVLEAGSADEAIALIAKHPTLSVLFTDVQMPGSLDGLELARFVKKRWPEVRIIISSGRIFPEKSALPEGVRFVAKPYCLADLQDIASGRNLSAISGDVLS